ncbi:MAG: hypothetical protein QXK51_05700 [Candidatus Methanomethylicia archaeon]
MPERGWAILTVRGSTAKRVRELACKKGLTVDELINKLINPAGRMGWLTCSLCGAKVKSKNLYEHMLKVHPKISTD